MTVKEAFTAELNFILEELEEAIKEDNPAATRVLSLAIVGLVETHRKKLSRKDIRDALNNPVARRIAQQFGME